MKRPHDEVFDCGFEDGEGILIFIFDLFIIIVLFFWFLFLLIIIFGTLLKQDLSLFLNFEHFFRRLEYILLDFLDLIKYPPFLHAYFPGQISGINIIGSEQNVEIAHGERSLGLIVNIDIPQLLLRNIVFALFNHIYYKN